MKKNQETMRTASKEELQNIIHDFGELEQLQLALSKDVELLDLALDLCSPNEEDPRLAAYIIAAKGCILARLDLLFEKYDKCFSDCRKSWGLDL